MRTSGLTTLVLVLVNGTVIRLAEVTEDTEIGAHIWSPDPGTTVGSIELAMNVLPSIALQEVILR